MHVLKYTLHVLFYQPFHAHGGVSPGFRQRNFHVIVESVTVAGQVPDIVVHYTIAFVVYDHGTRHSCSTCNTQFGLSRDYNCDSTTIRPYHDAFGYDGSDQNYDSTAIRLRSDYDVSHAHTSIDAIRREQKMIMSIFRRSRVVVVS